MPQNEKTEYESILETLYSMMPDFQQIGAGAYKPGLDRILAFDRHLGSPCRGFCCIHIAGTNGKGSVSHMLASVLSSAGYRTGLYTSPHITDFRERIRVDGEMIPEHEIVGFARRNMDKMQELGLSFFEATVGMAFEWFEKAGVETAVIETGLGGRLDATNIITPEISVITNIALEHTSFLGDTLPTIAEEKAGIIKPGVPVVIGERDDRTDPVFTRVATKNGSRIVFAQDIFSAYNVPSANSENPTYDVTGPQGMHYRIQLDLPGEYQRHNLVTALAAINTMNRYTRISLSARAVKDGIATAANSTGLRGRWEILGHEPLVVADTGHNAHGLKEVVRQIRNQRFEKLYMVIGVADDKDLDSILPLLPHEAYYFFTQASVRRAMPADVLAAKATTYGLKGETAPNVPAAISKAMGLASEDDMVFIGGSTFVVADIPAG